MAGKRKLHTAGFKAQVALAAHKGDRTVNELAGHYGVHPTLIHAWKKQLVAGAETIFGSPAKSASVDAVAVPVIHIFTAGSLDASPAPKVVASRHREEWVKCQGIRSPILQTVRIATQPRRRRPFRRS